MLSALVLYMSGYTYSLKSTPNIKFFRNFLMATFHFFQEKNGVSVWMYFLNFVCIFLCVVAVAYIYSGLSN